MKDEYVVNGAICLCKFGTAPGFLKVLNNQAVCMNGKLAATDKTLGNVFEGAGFTMCKKSWPPRPCTPSIVNWSGAYDGVSINGSSSPLLGTSKGTCAMGCTDCICFQTSGQIPIPNEQQVMKSAMALRSDINPLAVDEPSIVTYHIYWDGRIEKHIPKVIKKEYEKQYRYIYHSSEKKFGVVCTLRYYKIKEKENGIKLLSPPQRTDIIENLQVKDGQTERRVLYQNGDVAEYGSNNGKMFWRLYRAKKNDIEIIRMPDNLNYTDGIISISYRFTSTQRRYASPNVFAGFIGALATTGLKLQTTGSCFKYGSCFPSSEHVNGKSIDTIYLDDKNEQIFITAMNKFGFNKQVTGKNKKKFKNAIQEKKGTLHNSHLHSGFNELFVKIVTLSVLLLLLMSCNQKAQSQSSQGLSHVTATKELLGDTLIAIKDFTQKVNLSCANGAEDCILDKMTINYYKLFTGDRPKTYALDNKGQLRFYTYKTKTEVEEHIKVYVKTYTNKIVTDSVLCYEYYNNANTLCSYEQLYYINIPLRKIWTVRITYDEDSAEADNTKVETLNLRP